MILFTTVIIINMYNIIKIYIIKIIVRMTKNIYKKMVISLLKIYYLKKITKTDKLFKI